MPMCRCPIKTTGSEILLFKDRRRGGGCFSSQWVRSFMVNGGFASVLKTELLIVPFRLDRSRRCTNDGWIIGGRKGDHGGRVGMNGTQCTDVCFVLKLDKQIGHRHHLPAISCNEWGIGMEGVECSSQPRWMQTFTTIYGYVAICLVLTIEVRCDQTGKLCFNYLAV